MAIGRTAAAIAILPDKIILTVSHYRGKYDYEEFTIGMYSSQSHI